MAFCISKKSYRILFLWMTILMLGFTCILTCRNIAYGTHLLSAGDLEYKGAFLYPDGEEWTYSGHAMTFYPQGDAKADPDGYTGSLYVAGNAQQNRVGEISIPAPVITKDINLLPEATVLRNLTDITGQRINNCTFAPGCVYRDIGGLAYLPKVNKIAWTLRDWYGVEGYDMDALGWSDLDMSNAEGIWHIGERNSEQDIFHYQKTCDYLFTAPADFAEQYLEGKRLIAGNQNEAGANGGSQGPTLFAMAPWQEGTPPENGQDIDALAMLYYREFYDCVWLAENQINPSPVPGICDYPGYRAFDKWDGGAWVESGNKSAIMIFGRKGLGDNCYGTETECFNDPCIPYKGYHAYPYDPQILFYDPRRFIDVMQSLTAPWEVLPYETYNIPNITFNSSCGQLGAAAYDEQNNIIYVAEPEAGLYGRTAVHVWQVKTSSDTITPQGDSTCYIPHITKENSDWGDTLLVDNISAEPVQYYLTLYKDGQPTVKRLTIQGLGHEGINLKSVLPGASFGKLTYSGSDLIFRMAFEYKNGTVSVFPLPDRLAGSFGLFYYNNFADPGVKACVFTNYSDQIVIVNLNAIGRTGILGQYTTQIEARSKLVGRVETWFPGLEKNKVEKITVSASQDTISSLNCTINQDNSQILFDCARISTSQ